MLIETLATPLNLLIIAALAFNLTQRSHQQEGEKKRLATLYIAGAILLYRAEVALMAREGLSDPLLLPALLPPALMLYFLRKEVFLFRLHCSRCGTRLTVKDILYRDEPLCEKCRSAPASVDEVDWENWQAQETAVLCYVFSGDQVLLIHKKTGLGKGKVNAPGGRIEANETPEEAVVRELQEEVAVTPTGIYPAGELSFIFTDGYSLHGHVYFAEGYRGEPTETDEADPFWVPVAEIPYSEMWEDDELWLPPALGGSFVTCRFIFDGDRMLSKRIETAPRS